MPPKIDVCPECDRASFETNHQPEMPDYWCHRCYARFDSPDKRKPKNNGSSTRKGLSQKLMDANPEEWP